MDKRRFHTDAVYFYSLAVCRYDASGWEMMIADRTNRLMHNALADNESAGMIVTRDICADILILIHTLSSLSKK